MTCMEKQLSMAPVVAVAVDQGTAISMDLEAENLEGVVDSDSEMQTTFSQSSLAEEIHFLYLMMIHSLLELEVVRVLESEWVLEAIHSADLAGQAFRVLALPPAHVVEGGYQRALR